MPGPEGTCHATVASRNGQSDSDSVTQPPGGASRPCLPEGGPSGSKMQR